MTKNIVLDINDLVVGLASSLYTGVIAIPLALVLLPAAPLLGLHFLPADLHLARGFERRFAFVALEADEPAPGAANDDAGLAAPSVAPDEIAPGGEEKMNRWIGEFPWKFRPRPGGERKPGTVAVRTFEPNPFGLYEITGNAWEWTNTWFSSSHPEPTSRCCAPANPLGPGVDASRDPASGIPRKVLKGGSFLCADNYCSRYRPSSRIPESIESSTVHISFRCIVPDDSQSG